MKFVKKIHETKSIIINNTGNLWQDSEKYNELEICDLKGNVLNGGGDIVKLDVSKCDHIFIEGGLNGKITFYGADFKIYEDYHNTMNIEIS